MKAETVRQQFIDFFREKDHAFVRSASLVPQDDPTLLFTNAGMNQFKNIFLEKEKAKHDRIVNSQKCIRVSGKHNDLEEVGHDTFHHTFFEMLGNWSFGDYYKEGAILYAWELFTEVWGLDKNRLWATVYKDDDEADELWKKVTDIGADRVLRFGKKDNFWEMGETGPCGPCSEIHYYVGDDPSKQSPAGVNASDQYWELWNLVFIQNNRNADGSLDDLPKKHVDTGAGLERIVAVLQDKTSSYDTDLFQPLIRRQEKILRKKYSANLVAHRAIADHIRMLTFSIADGVLPSNEGRGYVARRILRRAARFGHTLGKHEPFLYQLVATVVEQMGDVYPEVLEKQSHVEKVIEAEEVHFNETLDRGIEQFEKIVADLSEKVVPGVAAFRLYDTYGFPVDLTDQMAKERGLTVDFEGFEQAMEGQRERARSLAKFKLDSSDEEWTYLTKGADSQFLGYSDLDLTSESVIRRYQQSGGSVLLVLDRTPFYAEQGGQIADTGFISGKSFKIRVTETVKDGTSHIHVGEFVDGKEITSEKVTADVDSVRRQNIRKNHTATHLMHRALKMVLGDHVHQAGSLVAPDYLRFDLTHYQRISADELRRIEQIVNEEIIRNTALDISVKDYDSARKEGATAIFEEKYGDEVRVVSIGDFSKELCGGTHVERTGDIGFFKITEESSLAAGVRRMVAVTGPAAVEYVGKGFDSLAHMRELLNCGADEVAERVAVLVEQRKQLEKDLKKRRSSDSGSELKKVVQGGCTVGDYRVVSSKVEAADLDHLKSIGDTVIQLLGSGIGILGAVIEKKPTVVCVVTQDLVKKGLKANNLVKEIGAKLGGGGGGKPHLATAGGKDSKKMSAVLKKAESTFVQLLRELDG